MQESKKSGRALIIVKSSGLIYYQTGRSEVAKFVFSDEEVCDLEIIDSGILEKKWQQFTIDENLSPCKLIMILSPEVTFQKEIPLSQNLENAKLAFLENVPFENVGWRSYRKQNAINLVAANKNFYETLQSIFKLKGYTVEKVIPAVSLPEYLKNFSQENISSLEKILKKDMALNNLSLNYPEFSEKRPIAAFTKKQFNTNKNLSLLLLLFFGAVIILLGSYLFFGTKAKPKVSDRVISPVKTTAPVDQLISPDSLTVKIFYPAGAEEKANSLKNSFWSDGFKNTSSNKEASAEAKTKIILPSGISQALKQKLEEELTKFDSDYLSESNPLETEVTILLSLPKLNPKNTP